MLDFDFLGPKYGNDSIHTCNLWYFDFSSQKVNLYDIISLSCRIDLVLE